LPENHHDQGNDSESRDQERDRGSAAAIFLAVGGNASAQAVSRPDVSHYMVIIATSISGSAAGVQMATLTFPSERACMAAAAIHHRRKCRGEVRTSKIE
jgi:hypothetical protein